MSVVMMAMSAIVGTALVVLTFVTVVRIVVRARGLRRRLRARYFTTAAWFYRTRRGLGWRLARVGARVERRRERRLAVRARLAGPSGR